MKAKKLNIYNGFGITPTNTHISAGMDFYVPYINGIDGNIANRAIYGFKKSYDIDDLFISQFFKELTSYFDDAFCQQEALNILMLYCGYYTHEFALYKKISLQSGLKYFINNYLVFDENHVPGVKCELSSSLFINSGIKVNLPDGTAGIFLNKSGKGNAGFDVRAQVVDEDYAGYVHLSVAFTKDSDVNNVVYCGDKLTQMVILQVNHLEPNEISEEQYNDLMKDSMRGSNAFGSSDVKH